MKEGSPKKQEVSTNPENNHPKTDVSEISVDLRGEEKCNVDYLNFAEKERVEALKKLAEFYSSQVNSNTEEEKVDFPLEREKIEELIYLRPQAFETKRLVEVALVNSEFAPKLTREIANRRSFSQLEQVLLYYKETPFFDHCVKEIELSLKDDEMRDAVLMTLSEALAETKEKERVAFERFSAYMLEKPEKAARSLSTYLRLLGIEDEKAKELLNNKSLLLIGGGTAPIKGDLLRRGIDCEVTNIEPLLKNDDEENADRTMAQNFFDVDAEDIGRHNEVWSANNSLPTYAFNPEQVDIFYKKALSAVKRGGYLRILPAFGFTDSITSAMRLNRVPTNNESIKNIEKLKQRPDLFEVEEFETPPLKSFFGKEKSMRGVNIKVIGDENELLKFLGLV